MIRTENQLSAGLIAAGLFFLSAGCGGKGGKVEIPEMGFSMILPTGWQTDSRARTFFYEPAKRDENWGMVIEYQLEEGQTMEEFVENDLKESRRWNQCI